MDQRQRTGGIAALVAAATFEVGIGLFGWFVPVGVILLRPKSGAVVGS